MARFSIDINTWIRGVKDRGDIVVRKVSLDLFMRIVLRSPVDTGRFRGNWQLTIGAVPDNTIELNDATGQATISKAMAASQNIRAGQSVFLTNNLPYGPRLENGWSKQAPAGMVAITVSEFQGVVSSAVAQAKGET